MKEFFWFLGILVFLNIAMGITYEYELYHTPALAWVVYIISIIAGVECIEGYGKAKYGNKTSK